MAQSPNSFNNNGWLQVMLHTSLVQSNLTPQNLKYGNYQYQQENIPALDQTNQDSVSLSAEALNAAKLRLEERTK